jgi:hypothetical protein
MAFIHRVPSSKKRGILGVLCTFLSLVLCLSCATTLKLTPSPVDAAGVAKVAVTFIGSRVQVDTDPVVVCFIGACVPKGTQVHWDISTGEQLTVKINPSYDDKPCRGYPDLRYKRDPGFQSIRCAGSHCETVGPPSRTGCFKYDVTVTPSTGSPVTLDPDMIIM